MFDGMAIDQSDERKLKQAMNITPVTESGGSKKGSGRLHSLWVGYDTLPGNSLRIYLVLSFYLSNLQAVLPQQGGRYCIIGLVCRFALGAVTRSTYMNLGIF